MENSEMEKWGETLRRSFDDIFPELHDANMRDFLEITIMKNQGEDSFQNDKRMIR